MLNTKCDTGKIREARAFGCNPVSLFVWLTRGRDGLWWPALSGQGLFCTEYWLELLHWPVPNVPTTIDTLSIYYTIVSPITQTYGCFCPWTFFENTRMNSLLWNSFASCLHPNKRLQSPQGEPVTKPGTGIVTGSPCGDWSRRLTTCPLYVGTCFGKSILNKLVCKLDRMENSCSYHLNIYIDSTCWYIYIYIHILQHKYFGFIFISTSQIAFYLCCVIL